jgi:hypothetical protein
LLRLLADVSRKVSGLPVILFVVEAKRNGKWWRESERRLPSVNIQQVVKDMLRRDMAERLNPNPKITQDARACSRLT